MLTVPSEIKDLLHEDTCKKNIRIHFPNGERSDICNDLIVMDSVRFTESLCSQNELKFGLCESPVFECEVVGVGNIKGATIEVYCEIFCPASVEGAVFRPDLQVYVYPIMYGKFDVQECKRQADMNHRKITAFGEQASVYIKKNQVIDRKHNVAVASNTNYDPLIFSTYVMGANVEERLPLANYDTLANLSYYSDKRIIRLRDGVNYEYGIYLKSKRLATSFSDDNLYYEGEKTILKTKEEVLEDLRALVSDETIPRELYNKFVDFLNYSDIFKWFYGQSWVYETQFEDNLKTRYYYPYEDLAERVFIPYSLRITYGSSSSLSPTTLATIDYIDPNSLKVHIVDISAYPQYRLNIPRVYDHTDSGSSWYKVKNPDEIDYVAAMQACLEFNGFLGYLDRSNVFQTLDIRRQFGLNPSNTLYPGTSVYPEGVTGGKLLPNDYQSCWYDDEYTVPYGKIRCDYRNTSNVDCVYEYYLNNFSIANDPESYKTYDFSDNYLIKSYTWTEAQIEGICENIASILSGVFYMPVDFVGRGLPYVEAGDTFEILTKSNDSITTIVLNRTISGEQVLTDSYKSV